MRVTGPLLKVLQEMVTRPGDEVYGLELMRATGLTSGTLYPLVDRLEDAGWLESRWEVDPSSPVGPRRRFYRLTGQGLHEARLVLLEHGVGKVRWA